MVIYSSRSWEQNPIGWYWIHFFLYSMKDEFVIIIIFIFKKKFVVSGSSSCWFWLPSASVHSSFETSRVQSSDKVYSLLFLLFHRCYFQFIYFCLHMSSWPKVMIYYTIIEWFLGIYWKIFCENLHYQPNGHRPRGWYCKFEQNIFQCIPRNHSIIVLSHRLLIAIINHHFIEKLLKQNKLINRTICLLPFANR